LLIQQEGRGRGFFSLLAAIICWVDIAETKHLIPIVDFENYLCEYNEPNGINETYNSFEFFFEPLSHYPLSDVYQSKNVYLTDNRYPSGYAFSIDTMPDLLRVYEKYFRVRSEIMAEVDLLSVGNLVGVHYRGQEMRHARAHALPPNKKQMLYAINTTLDNGDYDGIYVCTEDQILLETLTKQLGSAVLHRDYYRTTGANAYKMVYPRLTHKYLLGREILIDTLTLAKCRSFVGCTSNVAAFARFLNDRRYIMEVKISNSRNMWRRPFNYIRWPLANLMPEVLGGFRMDASAIKITRR
jgi:hypothetical protein